MDDKCAKDPMGEKIKVDGDGNLRFKLAVILYNLEGDEKLCLEGIAERKESKQIH